MRQISETNATDILNERDIYLKQTRQISETNVLDIYNFVGIFRCIPQPYYTLIEKASIGINQCGNLLELCVYKFRLTVQLLTLTV